jgi:endonuclease V-like protein UPF0215 family
LTIRINKKGIRALGIAESFAKGSSRTSVIAGVVMRADLVIDGLSITEATVGGMDATQKNIGLYNSLHRNDINLLMLNGCVVSWYNVIDLEQLGKIIGLPIICLTYDESTGLEKYFEENFPNDWQEREKVYHRNGQRTPLKLNTGKDVFIRGINTHTAEVSKVLNKFTLEGSVPEPLRVAQLIARSVMKHIQAMQNA